MFTGTNSLAYWSYNLSGGEISASDFSSDDEVKIVSKVIMRVNTGE